MSSATPILPKMNTHGVPVAQDRSVRWWPRELDTAKQLNNLETASELNENKADHIREAAIKELNGHWVRGAREFLTNYIVSTDQSRMGNRFVRSDEGLISDALTRIRDDQVVQQSIPGIDEGTLRGLNLNHRDVLAAVALLSRVDHSVEDVRFRQEEFEPLEDTRTE